MSGPGCSDMTDERNNASSKSCGYLGSSMREDKNSFGRAERSQDVSHSLYMKLGFHPLLQRYEHLGTDNFSLQGQL